MRFVAALDTSIYGTAYLQGQPVDTSSWARKQVLQFLDSGIIAPADFGTYDLTQIHLGDLGDVADTAPNVGDRLKWDGAQWAPAAPTAPALATLTDVDVATAPPTAGQALLWSATATKWVPGTVASGGGGSSNSPSPAPSVIASAAVNVAAASGVNLTIPNTAQPGDLLVVFSSHDFYPTQITGFGYQIFDQQTGSNIGGGLFARPVLPGEPGTILTVSYQSSGNGYAALVVIRNGRLGRSSSTRNSGAASPAAPTGFSAPANSILLHFGAVKGSSTVTPSRGAALQSQVNAGESAALTSESINAMTTNAAASFAFTGAATAYYAISVCVVPLDGGPMTSIDEFNDGTIDPAWLLVPASNYPTNAVPAYREGNDGLSVKYGVLAGAGNSAADGAAARQVGFIRPLSSIGGPLQPGDAIVTQFATLWRDGNYRMSGLVLSTGASGAGGNQLYARMWINGINAYTIGMRSLSAWNGDSNPGGSDNGYPAIPIWIRIVRVSATTWRRDESVDGVSWTHGSGLATWANEPTHVGFAESNWNTGTPSSTSYYFLRRQYGVA